MGVTTDTAITATTIGITTTTIIIVTGHGLALSTVAPATTATIETSPLFEIARVLVRLDHVASIGNGGYLHLNFRLWACLLFVLRHWHRRAVDARPQRPSSESGRSDESILLPCALAFDFLTLPAGHPFWMPTMK